MTDKQIIIDGVDVSGCDYLIKENIYDYCNGEYLTIIGQCTCSDNEMCEYNPQCSYKKILKQLKAKEQECEGLKATLKVIAGKPCLNINDCDGNCLPHCKWNAHKLAQQALDG